MTTYYILDDFDIERLACEENVELRDKDNNKIVICTEEWLKHFKTEGEEECLM